MSEFHVEVVKLGPCLKHENADSLSITYVHTGYPVIFRTGDFNEGDLAVYVPIDSVVPDTEQWKFLGGHRRIKAKKLRGVFSMGMLAKLPPPQLSPESTSDMPWSWRAGDDVQSVMGIEKWEPPVHGVRMSYSENEPDQPWMPKYTDIEGLRKHSSVLVHGEEVIITEKIHGANGRWSHRDGRDYAGSHNYLKKLDTRDLWWRPLIELSNLQRISEFPEFVFYGEVFGKVQDLNYGVGEGIDIRIFDVFDTRTMRYVDVDLAFDVCQHLGLKMVPLLYRGPWSDELRSLAEGKTKVGGDHIREGFVVKPVRERWDDRCGRVVLKLIGEGYMLRKDK